MASIVVANNNDTGVGSLRAAVTAAAPGDTVDLSGLTGSIVFGSQINITQNVTITGPGANILSLSGNGATRMFSVGTGDTLNVSGLSFIDGQTDASTGGNGGGGGGGGAIANSGTLNVSNSAFVDNSVNSASGNNVALGGAILSNQPVGASLTITGSTFNNNQVVGHTGGTTSGAAGGAVDTEGAGNVTITDSTFTQNTSAGGGSGGIGSQGTGGAIDLSSGGATVLTNNTIVGNAASSNGALTPNGAGGGIDAEDNGGTTVFTNNIIAGNFGNTQDIALAGFPVTGGNNLIGVSPGGSVLVNGTNGNLAGSAGTPLDPQVDSLSANGGPTQTLAITSASPAINAGTLTGAPTLDQRGHTRVGAVDIGAFEYQGAVVSTAAAATPSPVTATLTALSVLGDDGAGESALTYTWSAPTKPTGSSVTFGANGTNAAKASTATFNKAGSYVLLATISDGTTSTTSSVSVTVTQTFTAVNVSPATPSIGERGTQQFAAVAADQFGLAMTVQPTFTWSLTAGAGGINSTGLYTAPAAAGTATVQASTGGINGTAGITVTNSGPTVATAAAATPSPATAHSTVLTVLGADDGGEANLVYTWTATGKPTGASPGFSVNGTNSAKSTTVTFDQTGSYAFTVGISDGTTTTNSSVNVTVSQTLTTIVVTPATLSLGKNGTQQFSAVGSDQFGDVLTVQPTFTWSKTSGVGSITTTGLYTAPATTGVAAIRAASGSVNGASAITVTNLPPAFSGTAITDATANDVYADNITTINTDGNPLVITATTLPAWLTLTDKGDGTATLSGTPDGTQGGANAVSLHLSDGQLSATQNFTINVDVPNFRVTTDGTLIVNGGAADDTISVWRRGDTIRAVRDGVIKNYALVNITGVEVYGLDGNDTISVSTAAPISAYILGGAQNDLITGGDEYDNVNGGGGKDTIIAGAGDDHINGGDANDEIHGGDGNDRLYGGDGNDALYGEAGSNHLWGGNGDDILFGGSSNDTLNGEAGNDQLNGGKGNDALHGGPGADTINGGAGTDSTDNDVLDQVTDVEVTV